MGRGLFLCAVSTVAQKLIRFASMLIRFMVNQVYEWIVVSQLNRAVIKFSSEDYGICHRMAFYDQKTAELELQIDGDRENQNHKRGFHLPKPSAVNLRC